MWLGIGITVSGICTIVSFYMAFLAYNTAENSIFLFSAFGLFWGTFFFAAVLRSVSKKGPFLQWIDNKVSGKTAQVSFVPHWFLLLALIVTGIGVLAALLVPILLK